MSTYRSNYKYKLLFFFGSIISLSLLIFGGFSAVTGFYFVSTLTLLPGAIILYFLLFVFAREISIGETGITYKTIIRTIDIDFSQIKDVKTFYTTRSLTLVGGDKQKADMFCSIKLKGKPYCVLVFGNAIDNYKELYSRILHSLKNIKSHQTSS